MSTSAIDFPPGTYVSVAHYVRLNKGGRTGAMLMRARMISEYGGVRSVVATFGDLPDLDHTRDELRRRGSLGEHVELVNVFQDYAARDADAIGRGSRPLAQISGLETAEILAPDGQPYQTTYTAAGSDKPAFTDYLRPDGSVAVRIEHGTPSTVSTVDHHGRVVHTYLSRGQFLQNWLRELVPEGDAFIVTDSRVAINPLYGLKERRMHVLAVFHNPHISQRGQWDGTAIPSFEAVLDHLPQLDGLVLLTDRQREEVALREGDIDNLFTVANPVIPPPLPDPLPPRDPKKLVIVARLEGQKRLAHALRAFSRAYEVDDALRLHVYGDGALQPMLEGRAKELAVDHAVTFHGYDPAAREAMQTSAAFLMTSLFEGYPLATLEAMSHGCPVISYDIRFGPREQISDGVDGFLVQEGDIKAFAARILEVTSDPDRLARMSAAAYEKAAAHAPRDLAADWARVFHAVKAQDEDNRQIREGVLNRAEIGPRRFTARIKFRTSGGEFPVGDAVVTLDVVGEDSEVVSFPGTLRLAKPWSRTKALRLSVPIEPAQISERLGEQALRLYVRASWGRAGWRTEVGRASLREGRLVLDAREPSAD